MSGILEAAHPGPFAAHQVPFAAHQVPSASHRVLTEAPRFLTEVPRFLTEAPRFLTTAFELPMAPHVHLAGVRRLSADVSRKSNAGIADLRGARRDLMSVAEFPRDSRRKLDAGRMHVVGDFMHWLGVSENRQPTTEI